MVETPDKKISQPNIHDKTPINTDFEKLKLWLIPKDTSAEQLELMRQIFLSGASYIFSVLMPLLMASKKEPTEDDTILYSNIVEELSSFITDITKRVKIDFPAV